MAEFSAKERMIATMLSSMPGLKKAVKNIYVRMNALAYRKPYKSKVADGFRKICLIESDGAETFFGYYDKNCERNGKLIFHRTHGQKTSKNPVAPTPIDVMVRDIATGKDTVAGTTNTYNWQQGARAQWMDDDHVIFNTLHEGRYCAAIFNVKDGKTEYMAYPVQDVIDPQRYLSINYARIMRLRPDYGYRNLPLPANDEMADNKNDGIFIVENGKARMLHSLEEIASVEPKDIFGRCYHVANHLMSSADGKGFIFIHRFYEGKRRHDRLMYSDFRSLRVLADNDMVSHCCWLDNNTVLGYMRYNNEDGFFIIDIPTGKVTKHGPMSSLHLGDGHPSTNGRLVAFDTYPDKSRMQHLFLMDKEDGSIREIAEVHHSVKYMDESRCDMHPRFSANGKRLYFDTVFTGHRRLAYIDIP